MRALAAVAAMVLIIGILGVILTLLGYVLVGFFAVYLIAQIAAIFRSRTPQRSDSQRVHDTARSVDEKAATLAAEREFDRSVRHPAWQAAVDKRRRERQSLVDQFIDLGQRIRRLPYGQRPTSDMRAVELLVFQTFGQRASAVQPGIRGKLDVEPPAAEVLHLDREFAATTDCRYGHWGEHSIEDAGNGRVVRRCLFCEPNTRWTERI